MASPLEKKVAKSSNSYYCEKCDYITSKKFNWFKHLNTQKHLKKCHLASPDNASKSSKKVAPLFFVRFVIKNIKAEMVYGNIQKNVKLRIM